MGYMSGYGRPAGFVGYWGNGDGRFLYPPRDVTGPTICGPVDSIRWEMLREGIEDYEYLALLDREVARAAREGRTVDEERSLLEVPAAIVVTGTEYTRSPAPILRHRRRIAEAIERLQRKE